MPVTFSDRNVSDAKDGFVECPSYDDDGYGLLKKELDKGIQVDVIHSTHIIIQIYHMPLFQNECKTFHIKMSLICMKTFFVQRLILKLVHKVI